MISVQDQSALDWQIPYFAKQVKIRQVVGDPDKPIYTFMCVDGSKINITKEVYEMASLIEFNEEQIADARKWWKKGKFNEPKRNG